MKARYLKLSLRVLTILIFAVYSQNIKANIIGISPLAFTPAGKMPALVIAAPIISSFSPASGAVGTLVTINGTSLSDPTAVSIGGKNAIVISNTGSVLVAMVMPGAATGGVSVTTSGGSSSAGSNFTITPTKYPSVQQSEKLLANNTVGGPQQGWSVAMSADGTTVLVGGRNDNERVGATWVYTRSGDTWTQQAKLVGTEASASEQGFSAALSADGNTAIIGGAGDALLVGAAWVFIRSNGVWAQQGPKLVGTGAKSNAEQGTSVSISADGNTAMVGGPADGNTGAAWIYSRSNGVWSQMGSKIVGTGFEGDESPWQGKSVALSADGKTAIIGGPYDNTNTGACWIFTRSGSTWHQQGAKLVGIDPVDNSGGGEGWSVALSADGNTALIGAPFEDLSSGVIWVFTRSGNTWIQQGSKLKGNDATEVTSLGSAISVSADGNTAMVGGDLDNRNAGAVWVYTRDNGVWTQRGPKLVGSSSAESWTQGNSVALSADGSTAIEGGPTYNRTVGAAWVFMAVSPGNALLANLSISSGTLTPAFVASTTSYTASVSKETTSIQVTPTTNDANATVKVNGTPVSSGSASASLPLVTGLNTITTVVTGQDGTTKTYKLMVTRSATGLSTNALLTSLKTTPSTTITTVTGPGYKNYTIAVPHYEASLIVTSVVQDTTASIKVNGTAVASGVASQFIPLKVGANVITVAVTAQDGTTVKNYIITATRASSSIATLDNLITSVGALNPAFAELTTAYTMHLPNATASIKLIPIISAQDASVTVNGTAVVSGVASASIPLSVGDNTINTVVTAPDGTTIKTYAVTVTRSAAGLSTNALLTSLKINPSTTIITVTGPGYKNYTTAVPNSETSLSVTSVVQDATASIKVNGIAVASGVASPLIPLKVGANVITVTVTAQDGATVKNYILTTTRAPSSIATLSNLVTSGGTLNPVFATLTTAYTMHVPHTTSSIKLTPTATNGDASITVKGTAVLSGVSSASIPLNVGDNTINTVVIAPDGTTIKIYTLTVMRSAAGLSTNALLSSLKINPNTTIVTVAGPAYKNYTTAVPNSETSLSVTSVVQDATAVIRVNGTTVASGAASPAIPLAVGANVITVTVTAQDGVTTKNYILTATRTGPVQSLALLSESPDSLKATDGVIVHPGVSPNGDGISDYLVIDGLSVYPDNELTIMDRSGVTVFDAKNYGSKVFDGHSSINGSMQLPGTYFYLLEYNNGKENKRKTGFILLKY